MEFTITFIKILMWGLYLMAPIMIMMSLIIVTLGLIVGRIESWTKFDSLYWAFITALTIGYGDIKPLKKRSRVISIILGTFGIMLTGMLVAITVEASSSTFKMHTSPEQIHTIKQSLD
ncbi:MAG: two pore domain potassium channel family protein [Oleispira sp.]|nr:two pore domain potassium channel family protein [Oleispira sp.]MBL4880598.1 two pore domain potassium channel family protein [Oleispira sp.]